MILSLQGASHSSSLEAEVEALLPRACQRLVDSQHLGVSPKSVVQPAIRQYLYGFAADPTYRHLFGSFRFPGEEWLGERKSVHHGGTEGSEDEDDEDKEETWTLSGAQSEADSSGLSSEYLRSRKGKPCGRVFQKGESVYRCKDCGLDDSCVLCAKCFKASDHVGHEVSFSMHSGGCGCCDCGDPEAWRRDVRCAYHHPDVPYPQDSSSRPSSTAEPSPQPLSVPSIPTELQTLIRDRIREAADFAIYVITQFPRETTAPTDPRTVAKTKARCRWNADPDTAGPWSVILWNDEKHTYHDVIETLQSAVRCSYERAVASAETVDSYGLEVVASSTDSARMWDAARKIGSTKLAVTVCATEDAVVLDCVGYLLGWLQDMCRVRIAGEETYVGRMVAEVLLSDDRLQKLLKNEDKLWKKARSTLRGILMSLLVIGQDVKLQLATAYASVYPAIISAFLLTDREPDNSVSQFSVQLFSAPSVATQLASLGFHSTLTELLYAFFTQQETPNSTPRTLLVPPEKQVDKPIDPESPIFKHKKYYFLFQDLQHLLFHESVQKHVIKLEDGFFHTALDFLMLFNGMNPIVRASTTHVEYETDSWVAAFNLTIHLSKLAKNIGKAFHQSLSGRDDIRRYLSALYHHTLNYLKTQLPLNEDGQRTVATHKIPFNGKQWEVIDFQVSKQPISFHHPVHLMYAEMLKNVEGWSPKAVEKATNGIHKSYASMLATLNEGQDNYVLRLFDEVIRGTSNLKVVIDKTDAADLYDTVLALLAQIRAGFWVRNGYGLRAQHLHHREYTLRETTYDQDMSFLQAAFASMEPSLLFVDLLDRFELMQVMNLHGAQGSFGLQPVYDHTQATTVLEEFLHMIIVVFSEPSDIEGLSPEEIVHHELIHLLLMGPYSYSEILKNITDWAREEMCFDKILAQVATFRAPDASIVSSDVGGTYILKDEYLPEINPYYFRYTRNQREQAMKTIKEKLNNGGNFQPKKLQPKGAFAEPQFFGFLNSPEFVEFLRCCLSWGLYDTAQYGDMVIDLSLHLIKMSLTEAPTAAASALVQSPVLHMISNLEDMEYFKEQRARIVSILDDLASHFPDKVRASRKIPHTNLDGSEEESQAAMLERKREAAKARQAAIMQQFAAAQKTFLDTVSDDEDSEDDLSDTEMKGVKNHDDINSGDEMSDQHGAKRRRKAASMGSCIVCQEDLNASSPFGSLALIQTSSLVRLAQPTSPFQEEIFQMPCDWDKSADSLRPFGLARKESPDGEGRGGTSMGFPTVSTKRGLFASACGHMMHISCFDTYCQSIVMRHAQQFTRVHPENPERSEFICPLCKSLGNVLLPVSENDLDEYLPPPAFGTGINDRWLESAHETVAAKPEKLASILAGLTKDGRGRLKAWRIGTLLPQRSSDNGLANVDPAERKMLERLLSVVSPLEAENRMMTSGSDVKTPTISHQLLSYTLSVTEIGLRGKETGTLDSESIPDATLKLMRSLLASLVKLVHVNGRISDNIDSARATLIWLVFGQRHGDAAHWRPFLSQDPLTFLIQAAAISPDDFYQFANLCFYAHLIRISHQLCGSPSQAVYAPSQPNCADSAILAELCLSLQESRWTRYGGFIKQASRERAATGAQQAYYHTLPFLRRAALLHGVLFPAFRASTAGGEQSEMNRLLGLLQITHPSDLVGRRHGKSAQKVTSLSSIMEAWDSAWLTAHDGKIPSADVRTVELEHPVIYELLGLPKSIDILMESTVTRKCKRCKKVPLNPAICLICGDLVCQQGHCCMDQEYASEPNQGECNTHMWKCGTSVGIYFLVKRCVIIYLYADKGTYSTAPYLDVHGEADPDLKKHRPLYLNRARYDEIRKLWLNHSVATLVARKLESATDPGGWTTF